jgi:hypothetical protein
MHPDNIVALYAVEGRHEKSKEEIDASDLMNPFIRDGDGFCDEISVYGLHSLDDFDCICLATVLTETDPLCQFLQVLYYGLRKTHLRFRLMSYWAGGLDTLTHAKHLKLKGFKGQCKEYFKFYNSDGPGDGPVFTNGH